MTWSLNPSIRMRQKNAILIVLQITGVGEPDFAVKFPIEFFMHSLT